MIKIHFGDTDVKLLNDRFTTEMQCFGSSTVYHRDIDPRQVLTINTRKEAHHVQWVSKNYISYHCCNV